MKTLQELSKTIVVAKWFTDFYQKV